MMAFTFTLDNILSRFNANYKNRYHYAGTFEGHEGPINTFAFNTNGSLLASGGDDEVVHLWSINNFCALQTLSDRHARWGQITVLKFISLEGNMTSMSNEWLCIGTGRGQFMTYRRTRRSPLFHELSNKCVFSSGDSVESFSYDPNFQRIVVTSHYGKIKVYHLGKETGNLAELWTHELTETIPRAVLFDAHGSSFSVYAMESGTMHSYDSETSTEKSVSSLKTAIGYVDICTNTGHFVIDNMFNGFDLYSPNRTSPIHTFKVESTTRFIKAAVFGEGGQIIAAGSDQGKVYLFGTGQKDVQQVLRHGNHDQIVQVVATKSTKTEHLVVSGASSGKFGINVWKKARKQTPHEPIASASDTHLLVNVILIVLFVSLTREAWLPSFKAKFDDFSSFIVAKVEGHSVLTDKQQSESRFIEAFQNLDDDALRKLLGVEKRSIENDLEAMARNE